jgi:RNA polymerase-binding protein DksA
MTPLPERPDVRAILETERDVLLAEVNAEIEGPGQMTYGSQAAAASHVFEQQRDIALRDKARVQLEAVEAAIARLDAGTYGRCTNCGRPIAAERLEAIPWAEHCIDCQRAGIR